MISYSSYGLRQAVASVAVGLRKAEPAPKPERDELADRLLRLLMDLADEGRPCPPNSELTEALGTRSKVWMSETIAKLEAEGHISVSRHAHGSVRRVVKILSTGKTTAPPAGMSA